MWSFDIHPAPQQAVDAAGVSSADPAPKPVWRRRWLVIRAALGFCAAVIAYTVVFGPDDRLRETALLGAFSLAGAIALGYIGFAVQDDRNWMKARADRPASGAKPT